MLRGDNRKNMHRSARLTPKRRELLIERLERGDHFEDVACAMGIYVRMVYKWLRYYREEGSTGLGDRSSQTKVTSMIWRLVGFMGFLKNLKSP